MAAANSLYAPVLAYNSTALGTTSGNYSGNIASFLGAVNGLFKGLHVYNIRAATDANWWTGKTRLAATVAPDSYAQSAAYNNLSWIDFGTTVGGYDQIAFGFDTSSPMLTVTSAAVNVAGGLNVGTTGAGTGDAFLSGGLKALGALPNGDSALSVDNIRIGVYAGTPRILLEDAASATLWEMDNSAGLLRFFNPGALQATLDSSGNWWVAANCSALSFTDRTPWPSSLSEAYAAVASARPKFDERGEVVGLDHAALHESLRAGEDGRNLSATVSALLAVVANLSERLDKAERRAA